MAIGHQCIENRHDSVFSGLLQGLTYTFWKPLPGKQFHWVHKYQLTRYRAKREAYIFNPGTLPTSLGLSSFKMGRDQSPWDFRGVRQCTKHHG